MSLRHLPSIVLASIIVIQTAAVTHGLHRAPRVEVAGGPGSYELRVGGRPFYVRGVSFSVNEDPSDPEESLTRARLRFHFNRIRLMGANTVRRYGDTEDTPVILDAARDAGLMVMMGFWLDHDIDYLRDQRRLDQYRSRVREWVLSHKDHPAVLMWVLGNETWGLLKTEFITREELFDRRAAYYKFVESLAQMVKQIDPNHPVMTVDEHIPDGLDFKEGLKRSLGMFRESVRSVDIFGINSYFVQDISHLHDIVMDSKIGRPYMVSEFGPAGYWLPNRVADDLGEPVEPRDFEKASAYAANWHLFIEKHRGWNLGGNAFVWKDKREGAFTWFGLTDSQDRLKPAYWSLREAWTGRRPPRHRPLVVEFAVNKRWARPEESIFVRTRLLPTLDPSRFVYTYLISPAAMTYVESQFTTDLSEVTLRAPGIVGVYRVYVYATTRDNTMVSTGSATFGVYGDKKGKR